MNNTRLALMVCCGLFAQTSFATIIHLESDSLLMNVSASNTNADPEQFQQDFYSGGIFDRREGIVVFTDFDGETRAATASAESNSEYFGVDIITDVDCDSCEPRTSGIATTSFSLKWIFSVDGSGSAINLIQNGRPQFPVPNRETHYNFLLYDVTDDVVIAHLIDGNTGEFDLLDQHRYALNAGGFVSHWGDTGDDSFVAFNIRGGTIQVPEPSTLMLLVIGLFGVARRRFS